MTNLFRFDEVLTKLKAAGDGQHDILDENVNATGVPAGQPYRRLIERARTLYRPDDMGAAAGDSKTMLPTGKLERLALPGISYKLAFTPGLLSLVYQRGQTPLLPNPAAVLGSVGTDGGGYVDLEGDGHWWTPSGRVFYLPGAAPPEQEKAQAFQHFFLPRRFEDAFGNSTSVDYDDPHNLLVIRTVDAVANTVSAANDYRVLQPALITDPNGNRAAVSFDVLGMVAGTAVMGKTTEKLGDSLENLAADLTLAQIDAFHGADDPHTLAGALLGTASTRIVYDVERFLKSRTAAPNDPSAWEPVFAATVVRETHVSDLGPNQQSKLQISFSYSDGYGREIQKKIQAEPGPVINGGPVVNPRWVGSGWTIFNNKGKPVRKYEPFFSQLTTKGHQFEFGAQVGVSPILYYDPVERVVATVHPNHTYDKLVFDPWRQETWDVNDTVIQQYPKTDPDVGDFFERLPDHDYSPTWYAQRAGGGLGPQEQDAATKAAAHANTPTIAYFDTLGRTFLTIADNAAAGKYPTRVELDIEGKQRSVTDALGRKIMTYEYDMLGTKVHQNSADAGERWMLNNVMGKPMRGWDSRDHTVRHGYDALIRPTSLFVQTGKNPEHLVEHIIYGEGLDNDQALNLRTRLYQQFDGAGVANDNQFDFKGNLLSSARQLLQDYKNEVDWSQSPALEKETFSASTAYDALNRPIALTTPDSSVVRPVYNAANLLGQLNVNLRGEANATTFVTNIAYNAKGQRESIKYGNGARTTYEYDPQTFRLTHLKTTRSLDNAELQDLAYTYDPVANITQIQDTAQQTIYFRGQVVTPSNEYTNDAIYRLINAKGREHIGQNGGGAPGSDDSGRTRLPHPTDSMAMARYDERYEYDAVGNILRMLHNASGRGWSQRYDYDKSSNRLHATSLPTDPDGIFSAIYNYDLHGNMTQMPHLPVMEWSSNDELHVTQQQVVNNAPGGKTYYVYDSGGQRARKVTETLSGTKRNERIYLGGFEVYRDYGGGGPASLERQTLHVMDDKQRIALVENLTIGNDGSPPQLIRYQFGNHLGSASLELDDAAQIISYEEYYPYGSTSYQAVSKNIRSGAKRYKYTGRERDEETALYYHGARYYAPWLGRWAACDPAGMVDGTDVYSYVCASPIRHIDPKGTNRANVKVGLIPPETVREWQNDLYGASAFWADKTGSAWAKGQYLSAVGDAVVTAATGLAGASLPFMERHTPSPAEFALSTVGGPLSVLSETEAATAVEGQLAGKIDPTLPSASEGLAAAPVAPDPAAPAPAAAAHLTPPPTAPDPAAPPTATPTPATPADATPTSAKSAPATAETPAAKPVAPSTAPKKVPNEYGAKGKPSTQALNKKIADALVDEGYEIKGGGGSGKKEVHFPGPGGKNLGSVRLDITAEKAGDRIHVQTVDTRGANSSIPDSREMSNLGRAIKKDREAGFFTVPKPTKK